MKRARQQALTKLFAFHEDRWGDRGTAFHTRALRAFHLMSPSAHRRLDGCDCYTLRLDDEMVGVMYGFSFKGRFYFYQHGYDSRFQSHGLGRAVLDLSIRAAIDEGLSEFDLLYGNESYKSAWTRDKTMPLTHRSVSGAFRLDDSISARLIPSAPCARLRAEFYRPMLPRQAERWRWHVKVALASAIAGACRLEHHAQKAREQRRPIILGYHRVVEDFASASQTDIPSMLISRAMFERHVEWLGKSFRFVSVDEIGAHLESGKPFSDPVAAITFDDGYGDVYQNAFPLLRRKGIPAAMFVVTDLIGQPAWQTHDKLYCLVEKAFQDLGRSKKAAVSTDDRAATAH